MNKVKVIENKLKENGFYILSCIDKSHEHIGHLGHDNQGSHIEVVIGLTAEEYKVRWEYQKKAHRLFLDEIPSFLHSLSIKTKLLE